MWGEVPLWRHPCWGVFFHWGVSTTWGPVGSRGAQDTGTLPSPPGRSQWAGLWPHHHHSRGCASTSPLISLWEGKASMPLTSTARETLEESWGMEGAWSSPPSHWIWLRRITLHPLLSTVFTRASPQGNGLWEAVSRVHSDVGHVTSLRSWGSSSNRKLTFLHHSELNNPSLLGS